MDKYYEHILNQFRIDDVPISCERYGNGHINVTYLVVTRSGRRYILQKISNRAFPNVSQLQQNIAAITEYLHEKNDQPYSALTLIKTKEGQDWFHFEEDSDWRIYDFIENSICLQSPETPEDFYQAAIGIGTFQQQLKDFPAETLYETIENFHNTPNRYKLFRKALAENPIDRAKLVQPEIEFILKHESIAGKLVGLLKSGELPLKVTHNDTKLNNVMLHEKTREAMCVIDLDTTMPGLTAYDFGDSIRFGAATAAEDEKDLDKMTIDLEMYRIFTRGFLKACPGLTSKEREVFPLGALTMTLECGIRFLTDYLEGDHYFGIRYSEHNLDRCRTQLKLASEMIRKFDEMSLIVKEESKNVKGVF